MKGMGGDVNTSTLLIYSAVRISNCRTGTRKKKVVLIIFLVGGVIAGVKVCTGMFLVAANQNSTMKIILGKYPEVCSCENKHTS